MEQREKNELLGERIREAVTSCATEQVLLDKIKSIAEQIGIEASSFITDHAINDFRRKYA